KILMNRQITLLIGVLFGAAGLSGPGRAGNVTSAGSAAPAPPPLPAIRALKLEPPSLKLEDGRDERRVLVWAETQNGQRLDVTAQAGLKADSATVEIGEDGYIRPKAKGEATVTVTAAGKTAKLSVNVLDAAMPEVRF